MAKFLLESARTPTILLGPPAIGALSHPTFWGEGSPTKIDYRKRGTLLLTSLLEDLFSTPKPLYPTTLPRTKVIQVVVFRPASGVQLVGAVPDLLGLNFQEGSETARFASSPHGFSNGWVMFEGDGCGRLKIGDHGRKKIAGLQGRALPEFI